MTKQQKKINERAKDLIVSEGPITVEELQEKTGASDRQTERMVIEMLNIPHIYKKLDGRLNSNAY